MPRLARGATPAPKIDALSPRATLPGGDIRVHGERLLTTDEELPVLTCGGTATHLISGGAQYLLARVPEGAVSGELELNPGTPRAMSGPYLEVAGQIAEEMHPIGNPAIDQNGMIYTTFSGSRGQTVPVSLYRLDTGFCTIPLGNAIVNPSGLALDKKNQLYVSSRYNGTVYQVDEEGRAEVFAEGLGLATGLAFDPAGNLYVGDRSGTIFKIDRQRRIFVFATLEPSVAAYHLAFNPEGDLYVSGPTTTSSDAIYRIRPQGEVEVFFQGLGRPQGLAFDLHGHLLIAAAWRGRRGILRISPEREVEWAVSGSGLVGLAFARGPALILATHGGLFHLPWDTPGWLTFRS